MAKYIIGKLRNKRRVMTVTYSTPKIAKVCVIIVRGIGYRAFALANDFRAPAPLPEVFVESFRPIYSLPTTSPAQEISYVANFEFSKKNYLVIRAGHTRDLCTPIKPSVNCVVTKKDRKLSIASTNKALAANLTRQVYNYRPPSAYTGRGVRLKHQKPVRKAGKKDKQRGRAF